MPTPKPVRMVPVIDTSASMTSNKYVKATRRNSKALISFAINPQDKIGVVNYDDYGHIAFPKSGTQLQLVNNMSNSAKAIAVIDKLNFDGDSTNIGGGILKAREMLDRETDPRGIVLLTDGYQNSGTDPLTVLPPDYPIYTCAMGDHANVDLMKKIQSRTGGKHYVARFPSVMMQIYHQINTHVSNAGLVANGLTAVEPGGFRLVPGYVSKANNEVRFSVVWDDEDVKFTGSSEPGTEEVSITLVGPSGETLTDLAPTILGEGYAIFQHELPAAGQWHIQIIPGSETKVLPVTSGIFEFSDQPQAGIEIKVDAPTAVSAGEPIDFRVKVSEDGQAISGLHAVAEIMQPKISIQNALRQYRGQLGSVEPSPEEVRRGVPEEVARLNALRARLIQQRDILAPKQYGQTLQPAAGGFMTGSIQNTAEAGSYNIKVNVYGHSPVSETEIQRSQLLSVLVE